MSTLVYHSVSAPYTRGQKNGGEIPYPSMHFSDKQPITEPHIK